MGVVVGLLFGAGLVSVWFSFVPARPPRPGRVTWRMRTRDTLVQAGVTGVAPGAFVGACLVLGLRVSVIAVVLTRAVPPAVAFGALAATVPVVAVRHRARTRRTALRAVWPQLIDDLVSGVRAGLSLPEALAAVGERGPEEVRPVFARFADEYRASGRLSPCLDALKERLADPVADRVVEALRLTHEVGGTDLSRLLQTLAAMIREDLRTRGELEARQSWPVNGARLAVAAPWVVLALLSTRAQSAAAYNSATGVAVLVGGALACAVAYRLMVAIGRLPEDERLLR